MKAIDLIRWAMQFTQEGVNQICADIGKDALLQPTARGGNHALWAVGHMTFVEGAMRYIILGEKNPVEDWAPLFATGTQPSTDASKYPSFDEVLKKFREVRAGNLKMLDQIGDEGLDRVPKNVPPVFKDMMTNIGNTLLMNTLHNMVHYGEIAVTRRAAGKQPLM